MGFFSRKISADDLGRVTKLEETVESLVRRHEALVLDLEEFYAKVNKARQRVVKEDRDAARATPGGPQLFSSREEGKAAIRQRLRGGA